MQLRKELELPNELSDYVGIIITSGLRHTSRIEFGLKHGIRLGNEVTAVTKIAPERYKMVAEALWQSISEKRRPLGVFTGDVVVGSTHQHFTAAIRKDVTLLLGAFPTSATTAEFVLFTPCYGLEKQFSDNVVFITA